MNEDGWFEIEEEIVQSCMQTHRELVHHRNGHTVVVRRKIRFCEPPSRAAERWLTEATRDNRTDPRLLGPTPY